jgi:alkanesulfonate monooxygenase SsuD/methylene tetrahydromethanopterin reductase-like flavin-dependent oxidoreductase (luciferase family)
MRVGVFLLAGRFPGQGDGTALRRAADAVVCAEAAGFDDGWIAEHHFMPYGVCPSAITFAAHALGRTSRIGIGTAVSVLSTAHPVALAEQVAVLDQLSGGRFHLGVGRGGPWVDLEVFGTGVDRYERGFAEGVDLLLQCLTRDRVSADGEHFAFREVPVVPAPLTSPRPAVTVACTSPATVELAAQRGLPMLLGMHIGDEEKAEMVSRYAEAAARARRDPEAVQHIAAVLAHVGDDERQARRELRQAMPGWLEAGLAAHVPVDGRTRAMRDPAGYVELLCSMHPVGGAVDCVDRLRATEERTGISHFILMVEGAGTRDRTLDNIVRLGAEVLPLLRKGVSSRAVRGSGSAADHAGR